MDAVNHPDRLARRLRRWPRILALSLLGKDKPRVTWDEFCQAQDEYEEAITAAVEAFQADIKRRKPT